jgi:Kef-type K+ transport system membrane component KefB
VPLHIDLKVILFLQVVLVVGLPLILWGPLRLGHFFPLPIIQIFAGIALGPSICGVLAPDLFNALFGTLDPQAGADALANTRTLRIGIETLANTGLVLFVFLAGCEVDRHVLKGSARQVLNLGIVGTIVPWIAGAGAAYVLAKTFVGIEVVGHLRDPGIFAAAFGLATAVTALPVLGVVLRELGFNRKPIGTMALATAGVGEAILWLGLAVILPFASGADGIWASLAMAAAGGIVTVLALGFVARPLLERLIAREAPERFMISTVVIITFAASAFTEATGLHAAIGAFLTGLFLPEKLRHMCYDRFDTPVTLLLLPFLFLTTGLKTSFGSADTTVWIIMLVAVFVSIGGKILGITLPAYLSGQSLPYSLTLGALMQCKGLMEIVIVTILLQKGAIGPVAFTSLVLMALVSTAMTAPLAQLFVGLFGESATQTREPAVPAVSVDHVPVSASPAASGPYLVIDEVPEPVPVTKPEIIIGRHSQDDIRLADVRVSRHHARLAQAGDGYEIHNLTAVRSEPNPMLVNGVEKEHTPLKDGDVVSLGGVTFTFKTNKAA